MNERFKVCYQFCFDREYEVGVSDHPSDRGGRTNDGVTQELYDDWLRMEGLPADPVDRLTAERHQKIWRWIWDRCGAGSLPAPLDVALFDYAINSGVHQASLDLQRVVGATVDGKIGPRTLARAAELATRGSQRMDFRGAAPTRELGGAVALALMLHERRLILILKILAKSPDQGVFALGWMRRLALVQSLILAS